MKRLLLLVPILLTSCSSDNVLYNVAYNFDTTRMEYIVEYGDSKTYYVSAKHFHKVEVYEYVIKNNRYVNNEFYVSTKELFVYVRI